MSNDSQKALSGYDLCTQLISRNPDGIPQVDDLVMAAGFQETDWLEFKSATEPRNPEEMNPGENRWDYRWHVAKSIIALANTNGGCILIGVNDNAEPVGLAPSDPNDIINNHGIDAFLRHLREAVISPAAGWRCQRAGHILPARALPNDLCEPMEGEWRGTSIVIVRIRPRPKATFREGMKFPENFQCLHCVETNNQRKREFCPVRTLGEMGKVSNLELLDQWLDWENNRDVQSTHYYKILEEFQVTQDGTDDSLVGTWNGFYCEEHKHIPFEIEITNASRKSESETESNDGSIEIEGACEEPAMGRQFAGPNADRLHSDIKGYYNASKRKLKFTKVYRGQNKHTIAYEGNITDTPHGSTSARGTWINQNIWNKLIRRGGSFEMEKRTDMKTVDKHFKVLVTGFEPFGNIPVNPSSGIVEYIQEHQSQLNNARVHGKILPVDTESARGQLEEALNEIQPDICIGLGAAPILHCTAERRARRPAEFNKEFSNETSSNELKGSWPLDELISVLRSNRVRAKKSMNAGNYVCEAIYWTFLNFSKSNEHPMDTCFIHVPSKLKDKGINRIGGAIMMAIQERIYSRIFQER